MRHVFSTGMARKPEQSRCRRHRPRLNLFKEGTMMTTPAAAIKTEISRLIDLQIQVFGRPSTLTPFELEDCRRRAERIKLLGQELDRVGMTTILHEHRRN